jgi:hypothetical protein
MNKNYRDIDIGTTSYSGYVNDIFIFLNRTFPYPPFSYYTVPNSSGNILIEEEYEKKLFLRDGEGCNKKHLISFKEPGEYIIPITSLSCEGNKEYKIKFIIKHEKKSTSTNCTTM